MHDQHQHPISESLLISVLRALKPIRVDIIPLLLVVRRGPGYPLLSALSSRHALFVAWQKAALLTPYPPKYILLILHSLTLRSLV